VRRPAKNVEMRSRRVLSSVAAAVLGAAVVAALAPGWLESGDPTAAASGAPVRAQAGPQQVAKPVSLTSSTPHCQPGRIVALRSASQAYAVTVTTRAVAYRRPGTERIRAFGHLNVNGVPTVFGVLAAKLDTSCRAAWYRVQLPLRPNGRTGWVRASTVSERRVATRILVDLSRRRVTLFRNGRPVFVTTAAIGSPATPTPTGRYYVNQKLVAPDPWGAYGPAALGISAFSPVLREWVQGGPIAIHGTNESALLGSAVSHGCIRVPNADVLRLFKLVPTGTPVLIRM
jgi:lipoprotein-anchoring transpeptidase ErfK/SrfK